MVRSRSHRRTAIMLGGAALSLAALTSTAAAVPAAGTTPVGAARVFAPAATPMAASAAAVPSARAGKAANVIVCTLSVHNPHKSHHVHGTVNVVVTTTCTSAVPVVNIRAALYRSGRLVKQSGQRTFRNTRTARNNAAVPCRNGRYRGWGSVGIVFPPRYTPPTATRSKFGRAVHITC